jgi:hypothetical protein
VRLFREIREQRYSGGYEAGTVCFETSPRVRAHADWGESRDVCFATGRSGTQYFFALVLGFSRLRLVTYLPEITQS